MKNSHPALHIRMLEAELERRKKTNPRYSLRAFARFLDMHPSALSRVFANKQELSLTACLIAINKLKLSPSDLRLFVASVAEDKHIRSYNILAEAMVSFGLNEYFDPREQRITSMFDRDPMDANAIPALSSEFLSVMDLDGRFLFANEALARLVGEMGCHLIGENWTKSSLPESVRAKLTEHQEELIRLKSVQTFDFTMQVNGELVIFERTLKPVVNQRGTFETYFSSIRDVTQLRRAKFKNEFFDSAFTQIYSSTDRNEIIRRALAVANTSLADTALFWDSATSGYVALGKGLPPALNPAGSEFLRTLKKSLKLSESEKSAIVRDILGIEYAAAESVRIISVPQAEKPMGLLVLANMHGRPFLDDSLELETAFANHIGQALANAGLYSTRQA